MVRYSAVQSNRLHDAVWLFGSYCSDAEHTRTLYCTSYSSPVGLFPDIVGHFYWYT